MWRKKSDLGWNQLPKSELAQMRATCPSWMRGRAHTAAWSRGTEGKTRTRAADQLLDTWVTGADEFRIHLYVPRATASSWSPNSQLR
jgi:hypothetical protein